MILQGFMGTCTRILWIVFLFFLAMAGGSDLLANPPKSLSLIPHHTKTASKTIKAKNRAEREYLITVISGAKPEKIVQLFQDNLEFSRKISKNLFHIKLKQEISLEKMQPQREQNPWILAIQPNYIYETFGSGKQKGKFNRKN